MEIHIDHLRGELTEGILQDVLARRATRAAAEQNGLDPACRRLDVFFHAAALLRIDLEPLDYQAGIRQVFAEGIANAGGAFEHLRFHRSEEHTSELQSL